MKVKAARRLQVFQDVSHQIGDILRYMVKISTNILS